MPTITAISLIDRAATPVTHSFVPVDVNAGVGYTVERLASGSFIGEPKLSAASRRTPGSKRDKAEMQLVVPVVVSEVLNGVTVYKEVDATRIRVLYDWSPLHDASKRNEIQGMVENSQKNAVSQPFLNKVLLGLERVFG